MIFVLAQILQNPFIAKISFKIENIFSLKLFLHFIKYFKSQNKLVLMAKTFLHI